MNASCCSETTVSQPKKLIAKLTQKVAGQRNLRVNITFSSEYNERTLASVRYCLKTDEGDSNNSFGSRRDLHRLADTPVPEWVTLGESVLIRPYNSSGVVAYIGGTDFAGGTWIGVELDAPTGECYQRLEGPCTRERDFLSSVELRPALVPTHSPL